MDLLAEVVVEAAAPAPAAQDTRPGKVDIVVCNVTSVASRAPEKGRVPTQRRSTQIHSLASRDHPRQRRRHGGDRVSSCLAVSAQRRTREEPLGLQACPECGHQVSDRATACPRCGAPSAGPQLGVAQTSLEEWALSRLKSGSPRRQIFEELVEQGVLAREHAEALVKGVEAAALAPADDRSRWMLIGAGALAALILILILVGLLFRAGV